MSWLEDLEMTLCLEAPERMFICGDGVDTITDFNSRSDAKSSDCEDV